MEDIGPERAGSIPTRKAAVNSSTGEILESTAGQVQGSEEDGIKRWRWTLTRQIPWKRGMITKAIIYKEALQLFIKGDELYGEFKTGTEE